MTLSFDSPPPAHSSMPATRQLGIQSRFFDKT